MRSFIVAATLILLGKFCPGAHIGTALGMLLVFGAIASVVQDLKELCGKR